MPTDLIDGFRPGDELTANLVNAILRELQRLRKMSAAPPLAVDDANGIGPPLFWMHEEDQVVPFKNATGSDIAAGVPATPTTFTPTLLVAAPNGTLAVTSETLTNMGKHVMNVSIKNNAIGWGCWLGGYLYPLTWDSC